jgi:hypothetical protein
MVFRKKDWVKAVEERAKVDKNFLRSKDVARILDCSPDDVLDWRRKGFLEGRKLRPGSRIWVFREKDVLKARKRIRKHQELWGRKRVSATA